VLGHALYLKAIHGGQAKAGKMDALKIAALLRGGLLPQAYVSPRGMRATRAPLRRRTSLVRKRAEALVPLQNPNGPYHLPPLTQKLSYAESRAALDFPARFTGPSAQKDGERDPALRDTDGEPLRAVELYLTRTAKVDDPQAYQRLRPIPGVGP